jgi:hypothetical protein
MVAIDITDLENSGNVLNIPHNVEARHRSPRADYCRLDARRYPDVHEVVARWIPPVVF